MTRFWIWRPLPYDTARHMGDMTRNLGLILHRQQGNNSPYGWFSNDKNQVNSHWWVAKDGHIECYVLPPKPSWAQAAGNATYCSVETEGYVQEDLTGAQLESLAELYAYGAKNYGWVYEVSNSPGNPGFGWHGMGGVAWGNHPDCPGEKAKAARAGILARARVIAEGTKPVANTYVFAEDTDGSAVAGMLLTYRIPGWYLAPSVSDAKRFLGKYNLVVVGGPAMAALGNPAPQAGLTACVGRTAVETANQFRALLDKAASV